MKVYLSAFNIFPLLLILISFNYTSISSCAQEKKIGIILEIYSSDHTCTFSIFHASNMSMFYHLYDIQPYTTTLSFTYVSSSPLSNIFAVIQVFFMGLNISNYQSAFLTIITQHSKLKGSGQSLTRVWHFVIPWTAARQASLSITNFQSLPKPMSIESVMPSNHFILCRPLLLLPSISPNIRVFSNESALPIRWPKYWSFSFNISPSSEHPGLISFRMDWLDLLAVQGTLKSLLQHHSSKASILWHSAFFIVQLSHPYTTTGKTTALTRRTFVDKVMSLLFNMLSSLVITFLPRSKCLLISWLQITICNDSRAKNK